MKTKPDEAAKRLKHLEARIAEIYLLIDPDKGQGGTWLTMDDMLNQIEEVLDYQCSM
jgi:hypothetical protein